MWNRTKFKGTKVIWDYLTCVKKSFSLNDSHWLSQDRDGWLATPFPTIHSSPLVPISQNLRGNHSKTIQKPPPTVWFLVMTFFLGRVALGETLTAYNGPLEWSAADRWHISSRLGHGGACDFSAPKKISDKTNPNIWKITLFHRQNLPLFLPLGCPRNLIMVSKWVSYDL